MFFSSSVPLNSIEQEKRKNTSEEEKGKKKTETLYYCTGKFIPRIVGILFCFRLLLLPPFLFLRFIRKRQES